jgi:hypothetical protein
MVAPKPPIPWSPKDPRMRYTSSTFRPYATALGQLALAWNGLHERLAFMYCMLMGGGQVNHFFATWYAIKNDRYQRDMFLAAAKVDISGLKGYFPRLLDDIVWIWKKCNEVEEARNNALHSPLVLMREGVTPNWYMGHHRATKLAKGADLLAELRWCRDAATTLSDFVWQLDRAMGDSTSAWPDRPTWQTREGTKRTTLRQRPATPPAPPQPSSG